MTGPRAVYELGGPVIPGNDLADLKIFSYTLHFKSFDHNSDLLTVSKALLQSM